MEGEKEGILSVQNSRKIKLEGTNAALEYEREMRKEILTPMQTVFAANKIQNSVFSNKLFLKII